MDPFCRYYGPEMTSRHYLAWCIEKRIDAVRVCGLMEIPRMSCRYRSWRDDSVLRERLLTLAREKPRFGYRRLHVLLCRHEPEAHINHKRECGACIATSG